MPIDLDKPIAWTRADAEEQAMLSDLQGNILKGHGRHATLNLFLRLGDDVAKSRVFVRHVGAMTTSALDQLKATVLHKANPAAITPTFVTMLLSHPAHPKLDRAAWAPVDDGAYVGGMATRDLGDDANKVEPKFVERADVLVIIAADPTDKLAWTSAAVATAGASVVAAATAAGATVLVQQAGRAIFRQEGGPREEGIEHFGYVDGRSQPIFLTEDIVTEAESTDGANVWDPAFPPSQVLVPDPSRCGASAYGSFFVFRKLEQDVRAFKNAESQLSDNLNTAAANKGRPPEDEDFAGASIVGRFEDGTPVVAQRSPGADDPVQNNFTYDGDPDGLRCPIHAHIRKTNPRTDETRGVLMARRGITFGKRDRVLDPKETAGEPVGLLFMSYQASLSGQFEVTQRHWANEPDFPVEGVGIDPVIGQPRVPSLAHNIRWGERATGRHSAAFGGHVTVRGGDYFFAPARSTLLAM